MMMYSERNEEVFTAAKNKLSEINNFNLIVKDDDKFVKGLSALNDFIQVV